MKTKILIWIIFVSIISISLVSAEVEEMYNETDINETEIEDETNDNETETNETEIENITVDDEEEIIVAMPEAGITPDSAFYVVDVFLDDVRATMTLNSLDEAKIRLDIMQERMVEMEEMANENKEEEAKKAEVEVEKQIQKVDSSIKKIKKIKEKDALELKEQMQRNAEKLETLKQILIDYDSDWSDAMVDALEVMKISENIIETIPKDFELKPTFVFRPGTSTFESMIAQCIESGESPEECEKIEDFCKEFKATTAEECVEMLSSGFLTPTIRAIPYGEERPPDPHGCSGFYSSYLEQTKWCCDDSDGGYSPEYIEHILNLHPDSRPMDNYYYRKGIVEYKIINLKTGEVEEGIERDSCNGNTVTEWICPLVKSRETRNERYSEEYECPLGCEDGACIKDEILEEVHKVPEIEDVPEETEAPEVEEVTENIIVNSS